MNAPKFKIGDRVKWTDYEGRARSGNIVDVPFGCDIFPAFFYVKEAQESPSVRWNESLLSLAVPDAPKFNVGDPVKWKNPEGRGFCGEVKGLRDDSSGWRYAMVGGDLWWHESHLSLGVPQFKVGDRVKWNADDGRELSGVVMVAATPAGQVSVRENADERFISWWHESHLSLDVPEPKQFATNSEVELGVEIMNPDWEIFQLRAALQRIAGYCGGACGPTASHVFHLMVADEVSAVIAAQKQRATWLQKELLDAGSAKKSAQKELADLRWALKEIAK